MTVTGDSDLFSTPWDRADGYMRINTHTQRVSKVVHPVSGDGLVFVDIEGPADADVVVPMLHQEPLFTCTAIIFRWPTLSAQGSKQKKAIANFLEHGPLRAFLTGCGVAHIGVIQFALGQAPVVSWREDQPPRAIGAGAIIDRALRCEIRALLEHGHAIWRPPNYHYELPSGDHTDSFIRIADAFRTPRDVEALATWFLQRLSDNIAVILDTASLIPLVCEFRRLLAEQGLTMAGTETLDSYPSISLEIQQAIQSIGDHDALLAIMSVNASGRYKGLLHDAIRHSQGPDLVVLIDKKDAGASRGYVGTTVSGVAQASWVTIGQHHGPESPTGKCALCQQNGIAQTVRIDSRSFNAFALPQDNLLTPDVAAARRVRELFDLCDAHNAIDLNSYSEEYIREKQPPMGVKMRLDRLVADAGFRDRVIQKMGESNLPRRPYDGVVVPARDMEIDGFRELVDAVKDRFATRTAVITQVHLTSDGMPDSGSDEAAIGTNPLIFSLGSVSGWRLRRLQLHVQSQWHKSGLAGAATAVVIHARSTSERKWDNLFQSFEKRLFALWHVYLPDSTPHADELRLLKESGVLNEIAEGGYRNEQKLTAFFEERQSTCSGKPGAITAANVLFAPTPESRLRNTSNYGTRVNALTTFAAVAAAIQRRRQEAQSTDPRWPVFDFVSIGRSYFDGMLIACMLRWCAPSEVWWGKDPAQRTENIQWVVKNTRDPDDQKILYAELILAAVQGKIPDLAIDSMCELIAEKHSEWDDEFRIPILAGLILLSLQHPNLKDLIEEIDAYQRVPE